LICFCSAKSPEGDGCAESYSAAINIRRAGQSKGRGVKYITQERITPTAAPSSAKRYVIAHQLVYKFLLRVFVINCFYFD